jgi:hypothetical protein
MKGQFAEHLFEMKFINSKDLKADSSNRNSRNEALVRAVICAGLYPNVAKVTVRPCSAEPIRGVFKFFRAGERTRGLLLSLVLLC